MLRFPEPVDFLGGRQIMKLAIEVSGLRINLSSGHANFLWSLKVRENLEDYAMLYGISGRRRRQKVAELIELLELEDFAGSRFDELSSGTKQKLSPAKALINDPELLFPDEHTVGLDPDVAVRIRKFLFIFQCCGSSEIQFSALATDSVAVLD